MRKISESSTTTCPHCQVEKFTKMLSAPSFQLSGTGWYATDFKNSNNKPASNQSSGGETGASESAAACAPGCACH